MVGRRVLLRAARAGVLASRHAREASGVADVPGLHESRDALGVGRGVVGAGRFGGGDESRTGTGGAADVDLAARRCTVW